MTVPLHLDWISEPTARARERGGGLYMCNSVQGLRASGLGRGRDQPSNGPSRKTGGPRESRMRLRGWASKRDWRRMTPTREGHSNLCFRSRPRKRSARRWEQAEPTSPGGLHMYNRTPKRSNSQGQGCTYCQRRNRVQTRRLTPRPPENRLSCKHPLNGLPS